MDDKIKDKLKKLLAKADSAHEIGSIEEAAIFMAKVQEILLRYNLDIEAAGLRDKEKNPVGYDVIDLKNRHGWNKTQGDWMIRLYNEVSGYNMCKIVSHGLSSLTLLGEQHNREMVIYMCSFIIPKIPPMARESYKNYKFEKRGTFMRNYLRGAVLGISAKLSKQHEEDIKTYPTMGGLVKVQDALVDEKIQEIFSKTRNRKTTKLKNSSGMHHGFVDGNNMSLNKGIGTNKKESNNVKRLT